MFENEHTVRRFMMEKAEGQFHDRYERALEQASQNPFEFLARHQTGDWGELCEEDKRENEFSVHNGFRILSAYRTRNDVKIWIITEADRSATTLLLPHEY